MPASNLFLRLFWSVCLYQPKCQTDELAALLQGLSTNTSLFSGVELLEDSQSQQQLLKLIKNQWRRRQKDHSEYWAVSLLDRCPALVEKIVVRDTLNWLRLGILAKIDVL